MNTIPIASDERSRYEKLEFVAFLAGLCLFFSTIEYLFPKPLPFFRLGLANLPILISLEFFAPGYVFLLVLLKVLGQGLVNGTLASYVFLFSLAGSFSSVIVMLSVRRMFGRHISLVGISLFGAVASNVVQILLSVNFIFGLTAWVIAPIFMTLGTGSGLFVGMFAERFRTQSRWLETMRQHYGKNPES